MNYLEFYNNSKRRLTEALLSIWAPGQEKKQQYFKKLFEEEPILAEPVFQSTFQWAASKINFKQHAKSGLLTESLVNALDKIEDPEYRFPADRYPYQHQTKSWEALLNKKKSIVVTSGTGSGKTECFMVPVLQDLLQQKQNEYTGGVQAIFLYPLNALMNSQQKRMKAWCKAVTPNINFAIYNGTTEEENIKQQKQNKELPELITRRAIRESPPQILFTNPTMLEYMMVRQKDQNILRQSKGTLRWILLDETHTYTGSSAAELAMQIRRILDAFEVSVDDVRFAATSATIDSDDETKLKEFIAQITGKKKDDIEVIGGDRIIPDENNPQINNTIQKLRKDLVHKPAMTAREIGQRFKSGATIEESLEIIQDLGDQNILPTRAHFFVRSIGGVFVCTNPKCDRHKHIRPEYGSYTTKMKTLCSSCSSPLLELTYCNSCGEQLLKAEREAHEQNKFRLPSKQNPNDELFDVIEDTENENDEPASTYNWNEILLGGKVEHAPHHSCDLHSIGIDAEKSELIHKGPFTDCIHNNGNTLCPYCGNNLSGIMHHRTSNAMLSRLLSATLLEQAEPMQNHSLESLWDGRKYIAFTDSRQGTSKSALAQNAEIERITTRTLVFHALSEKKRNTIEPGGALSEEEKEKYNYFKNEQNNGLNIFDKEIEEYEQRMNGTPQPKDVPIPMEELANYIALNHKIKPLFKHLNFKGDNDLIYYSKALLIDQLGRRPRRQLSLENMGFVKLIYPVLKQSNPPKAFTDQGWNESDWHDFLKISVDFYIRENTHISLDYQIRKYITQNYFSDSIYAPHIEDARLKTWPKVSGWANNKPNERQSKLVLLLCAAMGINDTDVLKDEMETINIILNHAWRVVSTKLLTTTDSKSIDPNNHGYRLNLFSKNVEVQLLNEARLCPVTNVPLDTTFRGYSPAIKGYVSQNNFDRYKTTKTITFPYFPYAHLKKTDNDGLLAASSQSEIMNWIDNNLEEIKELGLWSNMHERILLNYPVYLAAEHSAQQQKKLLENIEEKFNQGELNILSCSTTMEMGVDIGGISEVVMNNVPPKPANYLQRAGRAGRRSEPRALALTICSPTPIGASAFNDPQWAMTHKTAMSVVRLESNALLQRHINSFLFAHFVRNISGINVTSKIGCFFYPSPQVVGEAVFNKNEFIKYLNNLLANNNNKELIERHKRLTVNTIKEKELLSNAINACISAITNIFKRFETKKLFLDSTINELLKKTGYTDKSPEIRAVRYQLQQLTNQNLLGYLAEHDFIPSAGIPTGIVDFNIKIFDDQKQTYSTENNFLKANPSRHITQALAEYAPGNQVIINENSYISAGLQLQTLYNEATTQALQNCKKCGYSHFGYNILNSCPQCDSNELTGIQNVTNQFVQVIEPAGFSVDYFQEPSRVIDKKKTQHSLIETILLNVDNWDVEEETSSKIEMRTGRPNSEILYYNKGTGFGFALCLKCGRADKETAAANGNHSPILNHKRLFGGKNKKENLCEGNDNSENGVKRNVLLAGRFQTDFIEIRFRRDDNRLINHKPTIVSLGVILSRKLTEYLGINEQEIGFAYKKYPGYYSIYIYDTAKGGAGYSPRFMEYSEEILDQAYKSLDCECHKACDKCLIDRKSQWFIEDLDRNLALKWIEYERNNRQEVPEEIKDVLPGAKKITQNLVPELIKNTSSSEIKKITFFVSNQINAWQIEDWPFKNLVKRLQNEGKVIDFVLPEPFLEDLNARQINELIEAKGKFDLKLLKTKPINRFKPLLQVDYFGDENVLFFAKEANRNFSADWGKSHLPVFKSPVKSKLTTEKWEIDIESIKNENQIIFEFKITQQTKT